MAVVSFVEHVERYGEVDSTMEVARARALAGAEHGATIVARAQRTGRGRHGRSWMSVHNAGLWLTTILKPGTHRLLPQPYFATLVAGVAVLKAARRLGAREARIKWPNDVVVGSRKLAGILLEGEQLDSAAPILLVGIGFNLAPCARLSLPAELVQRYVGLSDITGQEYESDTERDACLMVLLAELEAAYASWLEHGPQVALAAFRAADALANTWVRAEGRSGLIEGVARGIGDDGALVVDTDAGCQRVTSGEVVAVRAARH